MGKANRKPWLFRVAVIAFLLAGSLALQGCDNNLVNGPPDPPRIVPPPPLPPLPEDPTFRPPAPPANDTSPVAAAQRLQNLMTQADFEYLFPRRMGSDYWAEYEGNLGRPRIDYFSYENLLNAINFMANLVVITESSNNPEGFGHWNSRQILYNKTTNQRITISTGENWYDSWNLAPGHSETARLDFGAFLAVGTDNDRRRELAAFLANVTQETARGTGVDRSYGGLFYNEEVAFAGSTGRNYWAYAYGQPAGTPHPLGPAQAGRSYHGRGPMQLSWNFNYGQASAVIFGYRYVLLRDPDKILRDGIVGWKTAIWFWMTPQSPRPSCHQVMTRTWPQSGTGQVTWEPTEQVGFGHTIMVINGGYEGGLTEAEDGRILGRTSSYRRFAARLGADITDEKLDTLGMDSYNWFRR